MSNKLLVYGAGGAAKDIIRLIEQTEKWNILGIIVDGDNYEERILGYKIIGDYKEVEKFVEIGIVIANGDPKSKKKMVKKLSTYSHVFYPNIIHPDVFLHHSIQINSGVIIEQGVIITSNVKISNFVSVNIGATISHDCEIGDYVTISPQAAIAGNVTIEKESYIGINATIIERITIKESAFVAAGAVVTKSVDSYTLVGGVPAKILKKLDI